jgi:hypothetical protein
VTGETVQPGLPMHRGDDDSGAVVLLVQHGAEPSGLPRATVPSTPFDGHPINAILSVLPPVALVVPQPVSRRMAQSPPVELVVYEMTILSGI